MKENTKHTRFQNPYYEGDVELCGEVTSKPKIVPNWDETEVVTSTKNIYYEIWNTLSCIILIVKNKLSNIRLEYTI